MVPSILRLRDALKLGPLNHVRNVLARRRARKTREATYRLRSRYATTPITCRSESADESVFNLVFIEREYSCLDSIASPRLIVDCGANIGCASVYFLSRFSSARVVCVEPDAQNFRQLLENTKTYGERVSAMNAGIWPESGRLRIADRSYRDGSELTRQVEQCPDSTLGQIPALTVEDILQQTQSDRISILKIDIEGAEVPLFAGSCDWLERVDNLVIELHDDTHFGNATETFHRAISGRGFRISRFGESTIASRDEQAS